MCRSALEGTDRPLPPAYKVTAQSVANKGEPFLSGLAPNPQALQAFLDTCNPLPAPGEKAAAGPAATAAAAAAARAKGKHWVLHAFVTPQQQLEMNLPHLRWDPVLPAILSFYSYAAAVVQKKDGKSSPASSPSGSSVAAAGKAADAAATGAAGTALVTAGDVSAGSSLDTNAITSSSMTPTLDAKVLDDVVPSMEGGNGSAEGVIVGPHDLAVATTAAGGGKVGADCSNAEAEGKAALVGYGNASASGTDAKAGADAVEKAVKDSESSGVTLAAGGNEVAAVDAGKSETAVAEVDEAAAAALAAGGEKVVASESDGTGVVPGDEVVLAPAVGAIQQTVAAETITREQMAA